MLEMLKIPRLRIRLDCMYLRNNLPASLDVVLNVAKTVGQAIREVSR
jgi:hypothetical protein